MARQSLPPTNRASAMERPTETAPPTGPSPGLRIRAARRITVPWNQPYSPLNASGTGAVSIVNGVWNGQITILQFAPAAELHAAITGQPLTRSNPFAVTTAGANSPPVFTKGSDVTTNEDGGSQAFAGWATGISPGPLSDAGQTVSFLVSADNTALFATQPTVSSTGTLAFAPALNVHGSTLVTVRARDNGGTANGGADTSAAQTFTITILPVNDPPTITGGANLIVSQIAGPQNIAWATFGVGPPNESGQTIGTSTQNDNPGLFAVEPGVATNGTLTFTPSAGASGVANVTLTITDSGGTDNGGSNTTAHNFTITVTGINDPPSFAAGADVVAPINSTYSKPWAGSIAPGPADESAQNVAFYVLTNSNPSLFTKAPAISPDGVLSFTAAKTSGTASLTVQLRDSGGTANGGSDASAVASFTIRLTSLGAAQGKYRTLVSPAGSPTHEQAGLGEFTLNAKGGFTGLLKLGGKSFRVAGLFDGGGAAKFGRSGAALTLKRKLPLTPLSLSLHLDLAAEPPIFSGQILDGATPLSTFTALRDAYHAKTNPVPLSLLNPLADKGGYTAAFTARPAPNGALDATQFPQGDGWAVVKLAAGGTLTMRGQFADGTKFTYASGLNAANTFPFYVPLYRSGGAANGTIAFTAPGMASAGLAWFRPAQLLPRPAPQYPQGWPAGIVVGFEGSTRNIVTEPNALPIGNASLTLEGGNPDVARISKSFVIGARNRVTVPLPNTGKVALKLKPTGEWSGSFTHPVTGRRTLQQGVILRHRGAGTGFFVGGSESGKAEIILTP
jgi:Bacterial Ig domain